MIFGCLLLGIGLLRRRCQGLGIVTIYYYLYASGEAVSLFRFSTFRVTKKRTGNL
jgi:hypothetical protein